jgi:hypothetical protein
LRRERSPLILGLRRRRRETKPVEKAVHKRYLEYRDLHVYFGGKKPIMTATDFTVADAEYGALQAKGESRDDEEEARLVELARLLHRD